MKQNKFSQLIFLVGANTKLEDCVMMKTTKWIVVTGLDGSGKTTLVKNLEKYFQEQSLTVKTDRFPHDRYLVKDLLNKSKDSYTDRLLFALDNRLMGTELKELIHNNEYDIILTQRGFLDSFVHGAVQGYSYSWIEELNHLSDLPKCDIMIHMVAEASVAYSRICEDPDADKFEYPEYIGKQERETRKAYAEIVACTDPALSSFKGCTNIYVDTTQMTTEEVFEYVVCRLQRLELF